MRTPRRGSRAAAASGDTASHRPVRGGWTVGDLFWLVVPVVSLLGVVGYFTASVVLGTSPPFSVVSGHSMLPNLSPGDLVIVRGAAAQDVRVGDIISITTPEKDRQDKDLPAEIVHRVVKRQGKAPDLTFVTKGDNNPGTDAFITRPNDIRGKVVRSIPGLGYPVLFFRASQGRIFLGALGAAILAYFVIAAIERRQEAAELDSPRQAIDDLLSEHREDRERLDVLVAAVSDYGEHLRSHTQAVKDMAEAAQELAQVTAVIRAAIIPPPTKPPG